MSKKNCTYQEDNQETKNHFREASLWVAVNEKTVGFMQKVGSVKAKRPDVANLVF